MIAVIMQPTYLPWIGYFDMIDKADYFVILDNVQFEKQSWQQRNRIKTANGQWKWLSVPIIQNFPQNIDRTCINNTQNWRKKHWKTIQQYYCKSKYWDKYCNNLQEIYLHEWEYLVDLNLLIIFYLIEKLGISVKVFRSSSLPITGNQVNYLINVCNYLQANTYLSAQRASSYIEKNNIFQEEGITLIYHEYQHPFYNQLFGNFIPYMSTIDLLLNEGENSLNIIRSG
ncbi:WbqC-like protein family [Candidatus Magnetomorum sp. HK-1]|nr:WbqC-like protein family [Candidatus Magnetomorum sp. HK-1]